MRGEELPIKESLIRLTVLRRTGKQPYLRFRCEDCKRYNRIPKIGEGKTMIDCGVCSMRNYLDYYEVILGD